MQLTSEQKKLLQEPFALWRAIEEINGRPYPNNDAATFELIAARSADYGSLNGTVSAFARAAKELNDEGAIVLKTATRLEPIPAGFANQVQMMSSGDLRVKLNRDPAFAEMYGRWAAGEQPEDAPTDAAPALTAQQYRCMPASTIARKYAGSVDFRRQVDSLIRLGLI